MIIDQLRKKKSKVSPLGDGDHDIYPIKQGNVDGVEGNDLAMPLAPQKDGGPMGLDVNFHCNYHRDVGHHINDYFMLSRHIEAVIQKGFFFKKRLAK